VLAASISGVVPSCNILIVSLFFARQDL
jgi:hypothetical protein